MKKIIIMMLLLLAIGAGCGGGSPLVPEPPKDLPDIQGCPVTGYLDNCVVCHTR